MSEMDMGGRCSSCDIWINDATVWYCDKCKELTCGHCGTVAEHSGSFLCPECFPLKSGENNK